MVLLGVEPGPEMAVSFDYTDWTTFDGMPAPEGKAAFTLKGMQALLDKLVAAGLLPQEQATGARMMIAMFSHAAGEDEVTSEIEVKKTGEVTVNDQRVQ